MFEKKAGGTGILSSKMIPGLFVLMGSMDWLTTIVGIACFGAVERNPFMSNLVETNLPAFSALKLGTAFFVGFLFYQAEKTLNSQADTKSKTFTKTRFLLRGVYLTSIAFLIFAVVNNVLVVASGAF